jgi:flagellar biosynthetic protein FliR
MNNSLYLLSEVKVLIFALVLLRMMAFIFAAPIFGTPQINTPTKILFSLVLSMCIFPTVHMDPQLLSGLENDIITLAGRELLIGLCLGFICRIFFYAVSMTGDLVSLSLGLNAAQMFNPALETQGSVVEQFYNVMGILFFFVVGGHHVFLSGLVQSFEFVKVGELSFNVGPLGEVASMGQTLLVATVKMCAPVMVAILLSQVAMGLLGRAIPQINVLITSFPVTIMIGLGVIIICMPLYLQSLNGLMDVVGTKLVQVIKAI